MATIFVMRITLWTTVFWPVDLARTNYQWTYRNVVDTYPDDTRHPRVFLIQPFVPVDEKGYKAGDHHPKVGMGRL